MKSGLVTNLVCVLVMSIVMETIGTWVFPADGILHKLSEATQANFTLFANATLSANDTLAANVTNLLPVH